MQQYSMTEGSSQGTLDFLHQLVACHLERVLAGSQAESPSEPVKMSEEAQSLVLQCEERVKALAWKFARASSRVDVEEFSSIGMLAVCEAVARGTLCMKDPMAYLYMTARHAMGDEWRRIYECSTVSLDAPLSEESSSTLYDVLSALAASAARPSRRSQALNGAVRRLASSRQRVVLRRRYGFPGYGATNMKEAARALRTSVKAVDGLTLRGLHNLAGDARLRKVMGVEVQT